MVTIEDLVLGMSLKVVDIDLEGGIPHTVPFGTIVTLEYISSSGVYPIKCNGQRFALNEVAMISTEDPTINDIKKHLTF